MHNSETPLSCLALFEGGPCLTADGNFDVLMIKLKSHFQNAKGHKVESRGSRYRYCDFLIKVGAVTMSSSARGISVEVSGLYRQLSKWRVKFFFYLCYTFSKLMSTIKSLYLFRWSTVPVWSLGTAGT